ncbi:MAG TPA: amylo-alpha-1,6-glucosidase [Bryobacteraceae bacterium]|nr:amylo-alpha-1,6-glucosidase [Bryobacteraceae bacterium]
MLKLVRALPWRDAEVPTDADPHLRQEWLITNGLGGYASGTVAGVATRRYHGLLVAALPAPLGRIMLLDEITEEVRLPDRRIFALSSVARPGDERHFDGAGTLTEFRLEAGLPVWTYDVAGCSIEKRVLLSHQQNTVHMRYRLVQGEETLRLGLRPAVHFRPHDASVASMQVKEYSLNICEDRYEISSPDESLSLRLMLYGARGAFTTSRRSERVQYGAEQNRGYDYEGELWSPGFFRVDLTQELDAALVASAESWETIRALRPEDALRAERERRLFLITRANEKARDGVPAELILAADQFIVTPAGRIEDAARARAAGDEVRTIVAGYHWFTDWGRDTMISLEGLTLVTGRATEAGWILRTFAYYIRDGLIPNMFPEGEKEGLYHTADATLWFFHAVQRYVQTTGDRATLRLLLPKLKDIVTRHIAGTRFGIGVDPEDGLLREGAAGYQLTWMDAKVGDWVVTPRRGKPVEINALWYNALSLLAAWVREEEGAEAAHPFADHAARARESFNARFWYEEGGYLYDIVDGEQGDDASCRPNQLFAISLDHPVLDSARWARVLEVVKDRLLTPFGLRTLAPGSPDYKPKYYGDLRARDAAYHQGTVWPWLIGPFVDAWIKVHRDDRAGARRLLEGFEKALGSACIGTLSEIHDAEDPYTPRGCVAQAWSVAEVLRAWVATA